MFKPLLPPKFTQIEFEIIILLTYTLSPATSFVESVFMSLWLKAKRTKPLVAQGTSHGEVKCSDNIASRCFPSGVVRENRAPNATASTYLFRLVHCHQSLHTCSPGGHAFNVTFLQYLPYCVFKGQPRLYVFIANSIS